MDEEGEDEAFNVPVMEMDVSNECEYVCKEGTEWFYSGQ